MPGTAASGSVAQSHAVREPSSTGSPSSWNVPCPSAVLHCWASSSLTFGMAPTSAYSAWPHLSATMVFTQGMPWYVLRIRSSSATDRAWSVSKKWFRTRKFPAFTSRMANAVVGVHGSGTPTRLSNTGPYLVHHSDLVTFCSDPPGCLAITETMRSSIGVGVPSWRYEVGSPGTSVSWYGVNRNAVDTVWL